MNETCIGIDISKHKLDVWASPQGAYRTFENTPKGRLNLKAWLETLDPAYIVLEAGGAYERPVTETLVNAGLATEPTSSARLCEGDGTISQNGSHRRSASGGVWAGASPQKDGASEARTSGISGVCDASSSVDRHGDRGKEPAANDP